MLKSQTFICESPNYFINYEKNIYDSKNKNSTDSIKLEDDNDSFFEESFKLDEKNILIDFKRLILEPVRIDKYLYKRCIFFQYLH